MDTLFTPHNLFRQSAKEFLQNDPHLKRLNDQTLIYRSPLLSQFPRDIPGIYMVSGGRQVGKTTILKQWIADRVTSGVEGNQILFLSGELIDDHHSLLTHFLQFQEEKIAMSKQKTRYLIIDEVTYIKDWNKAVKYAADSGWFESMVVILTGSDLIFLQDGITLLPGRRGKSEVVDFHLYPLSFREFMGLKYPDSPDPNTELFMKGFKDYLVHGGYLTAINDLAKLGRIENATFRIYSDWIRGDVLKRGKQEGYLREILAAIVKHLGTQISWNALSKSLSIDHPNTVAEYIELLNRLDCVFTQSAILEHKLTAAPKKAKKVFFSDPFIFHAVSSWLSGGNLARLSTGLQKNQIFENLILPFLANSELVSTLVESVVVNHYKRLAPTYYIKAEGEVDLAVVGKIGFQPIEVKWGNQIRTKDLKQVLKYKNGLILTSSPQIKIQDAQTEFLPAHLYQMKV